MTPPHVYRYPIVMLRRSDDRLKFIMGISIPVKPHVLSGKRLSIHKSRLVFNQLFKFGQKYFTFFLSFPNWDAAGSLNASSWKAWINLSYIIWTTAADGMATQGARGWFNIKMPSYQYRKYHCGDKTTLRPSYLHNRISYTSKTSSLYWIRAQCIITHDINLVLAKKKMSIHIPTQQSLVDLYRIHDYLLTINESLRDEIA